jgi:hypothetical protein
MLREEWVDTEYYPEASASALQAGLTEAVEQAPWWLISVAVHGAVGLFLLLLSFTTYREIPAAILETTIEEKIEDPKAAEKDPDPFREDRTLEAEMPALEEPIVSEAPLDDHVEEDNNMDTAGVQGVETAVSDKMFRNSYWNSAIGMGGGGGGAFGHRFGGKRRLNVGRTPRHAQRAVDDGLNWLARHQKPDGTWSCRQFMLCCEKGACAGPGCREDYDLGVSGLALLAFLGAGNTQRHGKHKTATKAAIAAIRDRQAPDGCFGPKSADGHWTYNHAICTMAMAEAYGMTGSPTLLACAQKAVDFLVECQNPSLGWRYGSRPGDSDTSITGWAVLALKSARMAKLTVPQESFDAALRWVDKATDEVTYRTGYSGKGGGCARLPEAIGKFGETESMTAAGLISRIFVLGKDAQSRPEVLGGANLLKASPPRWDVKAGTIDYYYWYYGTLAAFQLGGTLWKAWEGPMGEALVPAQKKEGCEKGSWDPVDAWGSAGGRVYATAINTLTLEIYYRYGRIFKEK